MTRVEPVPEPGPPPLFAAGLEELLDSIVTAAIADSTAPGVAIAIGRHGRVAVLKGYGRTDWAESAPAVTAETIYDLASLTKVIASTTAAMLLEEEHRLDLDRPVASYLPEFNSPEKSAITPRLLLTHRAGFEAFAPLYSDNSGREQYLSQINTRPLRYAPGARAIYSDWSPIVLQLAIERITGQPLDVFTRDRIFTPLGMTSTMFRPPETVLMRVAPTEIRPSTGTPLHGRVHDENAEAIGGVSGHAGLFGSAADLALFAQMMLNGGYSGSGWLLRPETIARWTARQERDASRAYGWDTPSPGSSAGRFFSPRSFGHTGFTGTSMWIDPQKDLYVILLTNAVNPTRRHTKHFRLRRDIADAVQSAVTDQPLMQWEP
ncbi:MAG TPA: serine hydrolase domain-containing protein [Gemmatimonadaceae bacterium]|nr:serine hydrolase domain-containing protein [Gemmatimonadaceae bacterium]